MLQTYKRKTNRATRCSEDVLERASAQVAEGKSVRSTAKDFNIDKMTLQRFIKKRRSDPDALTGVCKHCSSA
ncbi:Uncharacterised protein r2_g3744 [Pycnogonum litorale]